MSAVCQRRLTCRAHDAFAPGRALLAVLQHDVPTQTRTWLPRNTLTLQKYGRTSCKRRLDGSHRAGYATYAPPVPSSSPRSTSDITESTASRETTETTIPKSHTRWVAEPNPRAVDYESGKSWHVFSESDHGERVRRLAELQVWASQASNVFVDDARSGASVEISSGAEEGESTQDTGPDPGEILEYEGEVFEPRYGGLEIRDYVAPWLVLRDRPKERFMDTHDSSEQLRWEIDGFLAHSLPNVPEQLGRAAVMADVRAAVKDCAPGLGLEVFGSERTGLAVATSDIDFRLCLPQHMQGPSGRHPNVHMPPRQKVKKALTRALSRLHEYLDRHPKFILANFRHARYPLISMQHKLTGIDVQIVCSNDTEVQRALIYKYLDEFPALTATYALVKTMFDIRGFCDVYRGGIGSYGVFMMVVAAVKIQQSRNGVVKGDNAANLYEHFLQFWSEYDPYPYGVTVEPPELFEKLDVPSPDASGRHVVGAINPREPYLLCLVDPADPRNDLGRKVVGIKHILATIRHINHALAQGILAGSAPSGTDSRSVNHTTTSHAPRQGRSRSGAPAAATAAPPPRQRTPGGAASLTYPAVGASWLIFEQRRKKLREFPRVLALASQESGTSARKIRKCFV